jgi:hypothetical protein
VLGWRDAEAELRGHLVHEQEDGDTVGTYVCADLDCARRAQEVPSTARHLDAEPPELAVAERTEGLRRRLAACTADVLRR